jgi:hypothetical protein
MPAFALAAGRLLARDGIAAAWRSSAGLATVLALTLVSAALWLPATIRLTPAERAAIPQTAVALGVALLAGAGLLWIAARRGRLVLGATGYALGVMIVPLAAGRLLVAVGDDRSAAPLADAIRSSGAPGLLGIAAYPPSLPFYLRRQIDVATETGRELTSNYIADHVAEFRALPGSPLKPAGVWREVLARCPEPTVFIVRTGDRATRAALDSALPTLIVHERYAAYGPCAASSAR